MDSSVGVHGRAWFLAASQPSGLRRMGNITMLDYLGFRLINRKDEQI